MRRGWGTLRILLTLLMARRALSEEVRPHVRIGWTDTPPIIDGHMDEAAWNEGGLIDQLTQVLPDTGGEPSQRTEIRILTDGETLFVGFRCFDTDPEQIVANRMLRDGFPFFDDRVGIALDTFNDHRNGYFFETNPRGMRHDVLLEGENFEISWDAIWFVEASIDDEGWTAEIAIPFSSLSFDPESDIWGFNVNRGIRRNDEENRWADPAPQRFLSNLGNAGVLEGMLGADQGLGLRIAPAGIVRRVDDHVLGTDDTDFEPTVDIFYKVLPSVTAAVTANTDFGEIEVDERQVNLSRFALFFPEKRDFFLEDGLIFGFGDISRNGRPFFSRRIGLAGDGARVPILVGGKLTGRLGPVKLGVLNTYVDDHGDSQKQNLLVARPAVNVLGESTVGAIITNGDPEGEGHSTTVGADFLYRNSNWRGTDKSVGASFWFAKSINEGVSGNDQGFGAKFEYPNDLINWLLGAEELQADYDPALGFVNRSDIRHYFGSFRYRTRPASGPWRTIDQRVFGQIFTDTDNNLESTNFIFRPLVLATPVGDTFELAYQSRFEDVEDPFAILDIPLGRYRFDEGSVRMFTSRNRPLQGHVEVGYGTFFDGRRTRVDVGLEWRPSYHWFFELDYEFNGIQFPRGASPTHLAGLRVNLQFTPNISWVTFVQYDNLSDGVGLNSRFHWIVQDGREFFIVLNHGFGLSDGIEATGTEAVLKAVWTFTF